MRSRYTNRYQLHASFPITEAGLDMNRADLKTEALQTIDASLRRINATRNGPATFTSRGRELAVAVQVSGPAGLAARSIRLTP